MANRPVFIPINEAPYYKIENIEFKWSGGFAKFQSQKNITAIHTNFEKLHPEFKMLEISSKSLQEEGVNLSAFSLKATVGNEKFFVECIYQGSKVFENGGPYIDLYYKTPKEAKTEPRLKSSGELVGYKFNGEAYPLSDNFTFYDYIYINALIENPLLAEKLLEYSAYTDIIFNPNKGINCQAKSAAIYKSLYFNDLLNYATDFNKMISICNK